MAKRRQDPPGRHKNYRIDAEIRAVLDEIDRLERESGREFMRIVDKMRQQVILTIIEERTLDVTSAGVIKQKIDQVLKLYEERMKEYLSENQRRLFVKGIQVVDKAVKAGDLMVAVPYLSEQLLEEVKRFGAELITGLNEQARSMIKREIDLGVLGQKPVNDVVKSIGKNLTSPSVFGTVGQRAQIIAQTEINRIERMATTARLHQVKEVIPDLKKEWRHGFVGIPRPNHLALNGAVVDIEGKFRLRGRDGRLYRIDGPYDPILPAGEVVNCRCLSIPVVGRFQKEEA